jgi:hypothetical protein
MWEALARAVPGKVCSGFPSGQTLEMLYSLKLKLKS